jgi:type IV pilus biogenesis protein CpaD/CtpE
MIAGVTRALAGRFTSIGVKDLGGLRRAVKPAASSEEWEKAARQFINKNFKECSVSTVRNILAQMRRPLGIVEPEHIVLNDGPGGAES